MVRSKPCSPADVTQEILSKRELDGLAARKKLADEIRAYREANGLTLAELFSLTGVPCSVISRAERGIAISISHRYKLREVILESSNRRPRKERAALSPDPAPQNLSGRPTC